MLIYKHLFHAWNGRDILCLFSEKALPATLVFYLLFILPLKLPNAGGCGLQLPQNLLAWATIMLCIAVTLLRVIRTGWIRMGRFIPVAVTGVFLLALPWLWTSNSLWQGNALPRLAGLAGGLLFLLALCQQHLSSGQKRILLVTIVLATMIQAFTAMGEGWFPEIIFQLTGSLPNGVQGVFQQRNLLGSWLATGIGITLYLAMTSNSRRQALMWVLVLYPLIAALILSQSRVGLLGSVVMLVLVAVADFPRWHQCPSAALHRIILLASILVWSGSISLWGMPSQLPPDFEHVASTQQRVKVILGTLTLISHHPWAGNGLGSFEALFPQALADTGLKSLENNTFTHPHNEVLFVLAEGGAVALAGLLVLGSLWLWPSLHLLRRTLGKLKVEQFGYWLPPLFGLPMVIHIMTEYPLYISVPHLMVLLLLFRCGMPESALQRCRVSLPLRVTLLPLVLAGCIVALIVFSAGLSTQSELTRAEDEINIGRIPVLPAATWLTLTQASRLNYDHYMLSAIQPAFWHSFSAMNDFTLWGTRELAVHNDAEISAAMMAIARFRGDNRARAELSKEAGRVFVNDSRFMESL